MEPPEKVRQRVKGRYVRMSRNSPPYWVVTAPIGSMVRGETILRSLIEPGPVKDHKVFGVGFQKTGTTSLGRALEILGYRVCDVRGAYDPNIADKALDIALSELPHFDAFEDNPWPLLYEEMDQRVDDAKFILTTRPVDEWIKSVTRFFDDQPIPIHDWIYGEPVPHGNEDLYVERYQAHNEEVLDYFEGRDDFLVFRIAEGEGWEKLCPFLDEPRPRISFPHSNARGDSSFGETLYDARSRVHYLYRHYILRR